MARDPDSLVELSRKFAYTILDAHGFCKCMWNIEHLSGKLMGLARTIDLAAQHWPPFVVSEWGSQLVSAYQAANWEVLKSGLHPKQMDPTGVTHTQEKAPDGWEN